MRFVTLIGLMGAGKSTVARVLAARWGWQAMDLDAYVEARENATVAQLFGARGEHGFRQAEAAALTDALQGRRRLLSTGGGAPTAPGAMDAILAAGPAVWLDGSPRVLAERATAQGGRPLLAGRDPEAAAQVLELQLRTRRAHYQRATARVSVDGKTPEQVADAVEEALAAAGHSPGRRLDVALGDRTYPIHLIDDLPGALVADVARHLRPRPGVAVVVTDANVGPLYAAEVTDALTAAGFRAPVLTLPAGEATKSLESLGRVLDFAFAHQASRRDLLIALGGGVVGDVTGFAAAVLHRGVDFVQIPTSLLAQVDSSVGGKTGVNHATGKNLIGAFWQPRAVVASQRVLRTLPEREVRGGLAEALKHGLIADARLATWCSEHAPRLRALEPDAVAHLVEACCRIKADVVASDEREGGRRAVLNFGHTFGHAYEKLLGYGTLTHGEAVALGMVLAAHLSEAFADAPRGTAAVVRGLLADLGLPHDPRAPGLPGLRDLVDAAHTDKKAHGKSVGFVLLPRIGSVLIRELHWRHIENALAPVFDGGAARER